MYIVVLEILIVVSSNFITVPVDLPYSCKFLFNSNSVFGSLDSTWCERSWRHRMSSRFLRYSRGYTSDFLLAIMMQFFFWKLSISRRAVKNRMCSHSRTGDATDEKIARNSMSWIFCDKIKDFVRGWQHMWFSPRAGDATVFEKIASWSQSGNRSCSRNFAPCRVSEKRMLGY